MKFKVGKLRLLQIGFVLLALGIAGVLSYFAFIYEGKPRLQRITDQTRTELEEGKCDDSALTNLEEAIHSKKDDNEIAELLEQKASCYMFREDNLGAIGAYKEAKALRDKLGDTERADQLSNLLATLEYIQNPPADIDKKVGELE